ncbi:MAG: putative death on curing protein [Candidatus Saccharibacteria bacterium]|nr:putative death on curing protein [Candidatus Saccharibacteria bacterium]
MRYLSEKEILLTHFKLIERYGGSHGTRDLERVKSAIAAPKQVAFGVEQYPGVFEKAAVYARNLIGDHPFADGNKRTGITVAIMLLLRNDQKFSVKAGELEDFAVQIATDHLDVPTIAAWLKTHCA